MLTRRLISSAVVITAVLFLMWFDHWLGRTLSPARLGVVLAIVVLVVAPLGGEELRRMVPTGRQRPRAISIFIAVLFATLPSCLPVIFPVALVDCAVGNLGWSALGWVAAVGWAFLIEMFGYHPQDHALERIQRTIFIAFYMGLLSFLPHLRLLIDNSWGLVALLSLVVTVKMSDSFAYLVGRAIGNRKLSPRLSPGKTVEGGIAGIVFGVLGSLIVLFPIATWLCGNVGQSTVFRAVLFGIVVTIVGIWGDLVESLIKRESDFKDSGTLIPGMGGVLDVLDSLLGAAPMAYGLWLCGLVGP